MNRLSKFLTRFAVVSTAGFLLQAGARAQELPQSPLTLGNSEHAVHILPTVNDARTFAQANADTGPMIYHTGGSVMNPSVQAYSIFWLPSKLQSGGSTTMSAHYQTVQRSMLTDYAGHSLGSNNTQYYQISGGATTYIQNAGGLTKSILDTNPYPSSGCTDSATPGNCITDAQVQTEIKRVMSAMHLTGGLNKIFMLFTSSGEGSCFDPGSSSCAYVQYCAYHGYFKVGSTPVIYSNQPYGNPNVCQIQGAPSPNNDVVADTAVSTASHELTEATTDPLLNAWFTAQGNEIGDLCAYTYGTYDWDGGKANQMWNGRYYLLQREYDNHTRSCVKVGP